MPRVRGWMLGVLLCFAAGVASGEDIPGARLREAQAAFDAAGTAWDAGLYAEAMEKGEHALALREAVLGGAHPDVATCLDWLGAHHLLRGNPVRAEPLLQRALTLREAALGGDSPEVARTLNTLGDLYVALSLLDFAMSERRLRQEALGFSEARLASFLQLLRADEERLYALLHAHPEDARIRRLALGAALLFKGRSVEESADISRTIYRGLGAQDRDAFERLRGLRTRLAELSLQGPGSLPASVYHRRLEAFSEQVSRSAPRAAPPGG